MPMLLLYRATKEQMKAREREAKQLQKQESKCLRGKEADIPTLSEAVRMQL